ncbi:MAG: nicotinate-nucleotide--dimethylbenzimidazole phosphoribosyltransferase [Thermoanaerobacteraceae bacterium]|nr:nicotinate-nucleotide--dimethylbenzimidazole phosphoribosyltransferase [Thermoanaerobacteraceae bacterium]
MLLARTIEKIGELDRKAMAQAQARVDSLLKPPGSLGRLEELAVQLAGITGRLFPEIKAKSVIVMAGDHEVVAEGVSAAPQEITWQILPRFVDGTGGIGVLARHVGAKVVVVDIGVARPVDWPGVVVRKVRPGAGNIACGPAMTREEAVRAIEVGIELAQDEIEQGADLIATGDMGIGNTTPSSAILCAVTGLPVEEAVGRGTMVNDAVLARKRRVVAEALKVNRPDSGDPLDILAKVGGLEIAGLAGVVLGAAARRVPVLLDGFITGAAALIAVGLCPRAKDFILASHLSEERAHRHMLAALGFKPILDLNLRLGEGTGAALAMPVVEAAAKILREMATFGEARVSSLDKEKLL